MGEAHDGEQPNFKNGAKAIELSHLLEILID
jgi:hypothetical protein